MYDTSGPYTDPDAAHRPRRRAWPPLRARWIEERGDTELLPQLSSEFGRGRETRPAARRACASRARRCRAAPTAGANVSQMHYARRGIVTPEMEYIAIRENQRIEAIREAHLLRAASGRKLRRQHPER